MNYAGETPIKLTPDGKILFTLRVTPKELKAYRAAAIAEDLTLSAWIRKQCNVKVFV
jgi:hypothetical protein